MILDMGIATCQPIHRRANFSKTEISPILCPDPPSHLREINSVGANSRCRGRKGHICVLKAFPGPPLFSTHVGVLLCLGEAREELSWSEQGAAVGSIPAWAILFT